MVALRPACASASLVAALLLATWSADASEPADRAAAAAAFDDGVARFDHADYAAAARSFLRADELAPSADAVTNAISAARKSNDHLLVVEAAERGVARAAGSPELATTAREALAEAARSLAHLDLSCEPAPCALTLDGAPTKPGSRYLLPGTHTARTARMDGSPVEEQLHLVPDAAFVVVLHAGPRVANAAGSAAASGPRAPTSRDPAAESGSTASESSGDKPLSPTVFYVGVGATAVLAGLTAWSGIDTLSAKSNLSSAPSTSDEDAVWSKARRTDVFLGGAVLVGALTVASGFLWVSWGSGNRDGHNGHAGSEGSGGGATAVLVPIQGGALAAAEGRF